MADGQNPFQDAGPVAGAETSVTPVESQPNPLDTTTQTQKEADNVVAFPAREAVEATPELDGGIDLSLSNMATSFSATIESAKAKPYEDLAAFARQIPGASELNEEQAQFIQQLLDPVYSGVYQGIHESLAYMNLSSEDRAFAYDTMQLVVSASVIEGFKNHVAEAYSRMVDRVNIQPGDARLNDRADSALQSLLAA